jgi:hypothetical protein
MFILLVQLGDPDILFALLVSNPFFLFPYCRFYKMVVRWDGHEIGVLSTLFGCVGILHGSMPRGWAKSFIHRQPVAAFSCLLFGVGVLLPVTVVPVRRALGFPTNQYDAEDPRVVYPKYEALEH